MLDRQMRVARECGECWFRSLFIRCRQRANFSPMLTLFIMLVLSALKTRRPFRSSSAVTTADARNRPRCTFAFAASSSTPAPSVNIWRTTSRSSKSKTRWISTKTLPLLRCRPSTHWKWWLTVSFPVGAVSRVRTEHKLDDLHREQKLILVLLLRARRS